MKTAITNKIAFIRKNLQPFKHANRDHVSTLPSIDRFNGTPEGVIMGEATILNKLSKKDGIYTFGANPCGIIIIASRNKLDKRVEDIALGHIDDCVTKRGIREIFKIMRGDGPRSFDVHIIGGDKKIAKKMFRAVKKVQDADIKFMCGNLRLNRIDAAGIDNAGNVYYGYRRKFINNEKIFDTKKIAELYWDLYWDEDQLTMFEFQIYDLRGTDDSK